MTTTATMDHLDQLEAKSVHIFREAYANFKSLCMLWSIGKDSTSSGCSPPAARCRSQDDAVLTARRTRIMMPSCARP